VAVGGLARFGARGLSEVKLIEGIVFGSMDRLGAGDLPDTGDEARQIGDCCINFRRQ
jgi:hypothetical protein